MDAGHGSLRIALIAPPWYSLPPLAYGGIEAMCATLADGLISNGHQVVTIGAGPTGTNAEHVSTYADPPSERIGERWPEVVHAGITARTLADLDVDIVHDHSLAGPLSAPSRSAPTVVTAHYATTGESGTYYEAIADDVELVAISHSQRRLAPDLPWLATVHNSLTVDNVPFYPDKGDHAVFLGRISPNKGVTEAIDVARRAGRRVVLAGKCSQPDERRYFEEFVRPRLGPEVDWIGEVGSDEKWRLLGEAACLLFPINWEEPFGMVMIEAMATGTPVVALARGSVPEVVVDSVTGFVRSGVDDLVPALDLLDTIDPLTCREHVRDRFDAARMIAGYEAAYRAALDLPRMAVRSQPVATLSGSADRRTKPPRVPTRSRQRLAPGAGSKRSGDRPSRETIVRPPDRPREDDQVEQL